MFAVAICLVLLAVIRIEAGWAEGTKPGCVSIRALYAAGELSAAETIQITGQVYRKDEKSIYLKSVILSESNAFWQSNAALSGNVPCEENFICEIGGARAVPLGSAVTLSGVFSPFSPATNPGEFDAAVYYRTLGIGGKLRKSILLSQSEDFWRIREKLFLLKCRIKERLYRVFPEKEAAVMSALLLGDKGDLDGELKDLYKRNGILHILSISSLHITIIGMSVYKLLRKAGLSICPSALAGSLLLLLYGCMTGFSVSACRAIGMYLLKMLAEMVGRTYDMLTALGVLAAVMVTYNPYYLQNSGFLLSFASVLGIGVVYPALLPELPGRGRALCQAAFASFSITLATLPVQLWFYYEVPVYSVFLNLLVIPFLKPMVIAGILSLAAPFPKLFSYVDCAILGGYEFLCEGFDRLPFHTWNPGCPKLWQIAAYYALLLGAVAVRKHGNKKVHKAHEAHETHKIHGGKSIRHGCKRFMTAGASFCAICLAVLLLGIGRPSENSVTFLDVGQGDCILVRTSSGQVYLFDCGSSSRSNMGKYVLLPCLKYYGIHRIDALFLSHPDGDHVSGALELFEFGEDNGIGVGELVLPAIEEGARREQFGILLEAAENGMGGSIPVGYLSAGDGWNCSGATFTCLHPKENFSAANANAYSECIYVEFREGGSGERKWSLLLTGDVEGEGEEALLREFLARGIHGITVWKAAHHGSRNSTKMELLEQAKPMLTVISCGRDNSYGHPHGQLLDRLMESGTYIMRTDLHGAITVTFRGGALHVEAWAAP